MATSPIYSWPEPDNTDLVKNGALAIRTLGNAIDTTMGTMVAKTVVDAKGDLIAGTAADTVNRLAVGSNGETLVADSSTSTGLRYTAGTVQANPVLNSAFQVWQRGTTGTANSFSAGAGYNADRWQNYYAGSLTVSRQATGDTTNLPFIQYCARVQRNAGQTNTTASTFGQSIETVNSIPFVGKTVTLSYYARAGANYSATSNGLGVFVDAGTGTDQNVFFGFTGATRILNATTTLTTTWQRFTHTFAVASTYTQLGLLFSETPTGTAGANDYYELTGVQIDVGSVALPFRTYAGTIQGELAACQRYYFRTVAGSAYGTVASYAHAANSTTPTFSISAPVTMRTAPTSMDYSGLAFVNYADTVYSISALSLNSNLNGQNIVGAGSITGATAGHAGRLTGNNNSAAYLGFSAEL